VRVRSPRAGYVPASGHVGWIILMTHSTRQIRAFAESAPAHTYASFLGCRRADLRGPQAVSTLAEPLRRFRDGWRRQPRYADRVDLHTVLSLGLLDWALARPGKVSDTCQCQCHRLTSLRNGAVPALLHQIQDA